MMPQKRRLSCAEAAEEIGVKKSWLQRHIAELPHGKLGRFVYFTDADWTVSTTCFTWSQSTERGRSRGGYHEEWAVIRSAG